MSTFRLAPVKSRVIAIALLVLTRLFGCPATLPLDKSNTQQGNTQAEKKRGKIKHMIATTFVWEDASGTLYGGLDLHWAGRLPLQLAYRLPCNVREGATSDGSSGIPGHPLRYNSDPREALCWKKQSLRHLSWGKK